MGCSGEGDATHENKRKGGSASSKSPVSVLTSVLAGGEIASRLPSKNWQDLSYKLDHASHLSSYCANDRRPTPMMPP